MLFFHRIPGSKFHMPDGREVAFAGGSLDTDTVKDPVAKAALEQELRKIADSPASMVYTKQAIPDSSERIVGAEIRQQAETATDGLNKVAGGGVTVEIPQPHQQPPALNPAAAVAAPDGSIKGTAGTDIEAKLAVARKAIEESNKAAAEKGSGTGSSHTPKKTP